MEITNPNKLLDEMLSNFRDFEGTTHRSTNSFCMLYPLIEKYVIIEILEKLTKDGYLLSTPDEKRFEHNYYRLTFEGRLFSSTGGYTAQKDNRSKLTNTVLQWTIAITGSVAAYYYILQIIILVHGFIWLLIGILILLTILRLFMERS